ncbi:hypothetical protein ACTFIR_002756 [Dictyostelium discoideum]
MKRSELQNHLESVNHQFYMSKLIDKLISKVGQSNKIINELNKKLEWEFNPRVYKNKWTISNYSPMSYSMYSMAPRGIRFCSPKFTFFSYEFQVCFYPHGVTNNKYPDIYLFINNLNGNSLKVESWFRLVNV